mmetsp:Transcript_30501/g.99597  ORF Transcript_30501/g.99597 Transcript_30501/m.99597 type:complete len:334 (+) Transcript_30501:282-1283(+)
MLRILPRVGPSCASRWSTCARTSPSMSSTAPSLSRGAAPMLPPPQYPSATQEHRSRQECSLRRPRATLCSCGPLDAISPSRPSRAGASSRAVPTRTRRLLPRKPSSASTCAMLQPRRTGFETWATSMRPEWQRFQLAPLCTMCLAMSRRSPRSTSSARHPLQDQTWRSRSLRLATSAEAPWTIPSPGMSTVEQVSTPRASWLAKSPTGARRRWCTLGTSAMPWAMRRCGMSSWTCWNPWHLPCRMCWCLETMRQMRRTTPSLRTERHPISLAMTVVASAMCQLCVCFARRASARTRTGGHGTLAPSIWLASALSSTSAPTAPSGSGCSQTWRL